MTHFPQKDLQNHFICCSVLGVEKLECVSEEHLMRIACFIDVWLYGLITIGFQTLAAPFLVKKKEHSSQTPQIIS